MATTKNQESLNSSPMQNGSFKYMTSISLEDDTGKATSNNNNVQTSTVCEYPNLTKAKTLENVSTDETNEIRSSAAQSHSANGGCPSADDNQGNSKK